MNYSLDSYRNFDVEQQILASASRKKKELEKQSELADSEIQYRFRIVKGYFLRLSWKHKKDYLLSVINKISCFDTLLRIISYISTLYGKMAAYTDVSPHVRRISQQILLDHDRTMETDCLKETACEDLNWIGTLNKVNQMNIAVDLLLLGGGGLMRKLYIPLVAIYNKKLIEDDKMNEITGNTAETRGLEDLFDDKHLDDTDKYPQDHPLSIEVEKLRKKWDEMMEKSRREVFGSSKINGQNSTGTKPEKAEREEKKSKKDKKEKSSNKEKSSTKSSKGSKKSVKAQTDTIDWVFPRLIKDDLLLYKNYPCCLKDVNILIDVEDNIRKQRDTLSYSLSQQLSDTFSMSEANLEDW